MKMKTNQAAIIISISLFVMTVAAIFAFGYAHEALFITDNPNQTLQNLTENKGLFTLELIMWGVILITDIAVSYGLYVYLKPVRPKGALLSGLLRIVYTLVLGYAIYQLYQVMRLISVDGAQLLILESDFQKIWFVGLILFGLHLIVTGIVSLKSKFIPIGLSTLLIFGGMSYALIHGFYVFFPQMDSITSIAESVLSIPMMLSELILAIWLIVRGRKLNDTHLATRR